MERLAQLQTRIASIMELSDIVGAMRSLAAVRIQQGSATLEGIRRYTEIVGAAIVRAAALLGMDGTSARPRATGGMRNVVVFCSEHGLVGGFNEHLLDRAVAETDHDRRLCLVGARGALSAQERGLETAWEVPMATHVTGVVETARRIAAEIYGSLRGDAAGVDIVYSRYTSRGQSSIEKRTILPLDLASFAARAGGPPPLSNLDPEILMEKLAGEYMLAELGHAAMESLVSENGARLQAMEMAHEHVADKLDELRGLERQLRQEETTTELLDVVTGSEAVRRRASGS